MKKLIRVFIIILFFTICEVNLSKAIEFNFKNFNQIEISIDGQVYIDSQENGVSYDFVKGIVEFKDMSITVEENGERKTYTNISERFIDDNSIKHFEVKVDSFSRNAYIIINAKLTSDNFDLDMCFTKIIEVKNLYENVEDFSSNKSCYIEIVSDDIKQIITHDVIFEIEDGGKFLNSDAEQYIEYTNMLNGKGFPSIPEVICDDNYKFIGWYNDKNGKKIDEFPIIVEEDVVALAKFEFLWDSTIDDINLNKNIINNEINEFKNINLIKTNNFVFSDEVQEYKNFMADNPPKSTVENNIVLLIVSYILRLTMNINQ